MSWEERVVEIDGWLTIREVYYDEDGKVILYTEDGMGPEGTDLNDIKEDHARMARAFDRPILHEEDLPFWRTRTCPTNTCT